MLTYYYQMLPHDFLHFRDFQKSISSLQPSQIREEFSGNNFANANLENNFLIWKLGNLVSFSTYWKLSWSLTFKKLNL